MSSLRKLKTKIKGVQFVEKITTAMRFTSQAAVSQLLPKFRFLEERRHCEERIVQEAWDAFGGHTFVPEHLRAKIGAPSIYIVFGPERGFCGAMTDIIVGETQRCTRINDKLWVVGHDIIKRLRSKKRRFDLDFGTREESMGAVFPLLMKELKNQVAEHVTVIYPHFVSLMVWEMRVQQIVPFGLDRGEKTNAALGEDPIDFWCYVAERYIRQALYYARMHTQISEHAARMAAMDQASKNAEDLVDTLRLEWQRCRQALVTKELLEVTAGAVALEDV